MASRLTEMRSERNARAKTAAAAKKAPAATIGRTNRAGQLTFNAVGDEDFDDDGGMNLITTGGGGISRGSTTKNKTKKKKKKTKR